MVEVGRALRGQQVAAEHSVDLAGVVGCRRGHFGHAVVGGLAERIQAFLHGVALALDVAPDRRHQAHRAEPGQFGLGQPELRPGRQEPGTLVALGAGAGIGRDDRALPAPQALGVAGRLEDLEQFQAGLHRAIDR